MAVLQRLEEIMPEWEEISFDLLINSILSMRYDWGASDGN